jgi:hypothetical protein
MGTALEELGRLRKAGVSFRWRPDNRKKKRFALKFKPSYDRTPLAPRRRSTRQDEESQMDMALAMSLSLADQVSVEEMVGILCFCFCFCSW